MSLVNKKWIVASALVMSVSSATFAPRTSHAIIGGATGNVSLLIAGGCLLATAAFTGSVALMIDDPSGSGRVTVGALGWTAFGAGLLGVLLLPNSSGYGYHYEAIRTIEMRDRFHLTTDMVRSYNRDLQRVNVVVNEIQGVLADLNVTYTEAEATNVSKRIWAERLIDFSPATRTALHNINSVIQAQN